MKKLIRIVDIKIVLSIIIWLLILIGYKGDVIAASYPHIDYSTQAKTYRIYQQQYADCGIASIASIEAYYQQNTNGVYDTVYASNGNSVEVKWGTLGYEKWAYSLENLYTALKAGPCVIERTGHYSVVVAYEGSTGSLETSGFKVMEIVGYYKYDGGYGHPSLWNTSYSDATKVPLDVWGTYGGATLSGIAVRKSGTIADTTAPVISNVQITDVTNTGYTVTCEVTDDVGVEKVCFPTWTDTNGGDDLVSDWGNNTAVYSPVNGNTYSYRVNTAEHNYEGGSYITDIWSYDVAGNSDIYRVTVNIDVTAPTITNAQVTDITKEGYTVTCDVIDNVGVVKVCFPTWTEANGGDDLVDDWGSNTAVYSPVNGSTYSYRINTADHNYEGGSYITDIWSYDAAGNSEVYRVTVNIDVTAPTITNAQVTDITKEGYTVTCDVTDNVGVVKVCFPTWTEANEGDDLVDDWGSNTAVYSPMNGDTYSYRVNISDHNYESGSYITDIWAYDAAGNWEICRVIMNLDIPLQSITLSHSTLTLPIAQPHQLSVASYTPSDTTVDKTVTWSSTNEAVATVQADGTVVGKKAGRTTITAEVAGKTASCIVTVIPNDGSQVYKDFLYKVTGGTATITGYIGNAAQINIPQNINGYKVTTIGNGAFEGCTNLTGINIPDEITNIGAYAFTGCQNLKTIELPKGVTSIGEFAFLDCDNLTKLIYHGTEEQWKNIIGGNDISINKNAIQYVEVACPHTSTKNTITKATISKNGKVVTKCTACNEITNTETIYKASTVKLSATSYTYNGKARKPTVTVKDSNGKKLKSGTDYTVSYASGRKNVGKYNVTIKFQGNYTGTKTLSFTVIPKKTSISKLTATKKGFEVKWKKQSSQTTGYQIQYSTKKNFQGSTTKNVTVNKNKTVTKSISKLSANKKYYVRIRTYKTVKVNGKSTKIYSDWSKVKTVTTKK